MKKLLLATTLSLTLVLGGCQYLPWNKSAEPVTEEVASPDIDYSYYNKVLDDYEKVAKGTLPTGMDVNPLASQVKSSQGFYTDVVYHKTDLNNDGVDELLLALETCSKHLHFEQSYLRHLGRSKNCTEHQKSIDSLLSHQLDSKKNLTIQFDLS